MNPVVDSRLYAKMNAPSFSYASTHWFPIIPSDLPPSSVFWEAENIHGRLRDLQETINLTKSMLKELETLSIIKENSNDITATPSISVLLDRIVKHKNNFSSQEIFSLDAASSLISKLNKQLEPFRILTDGKTPWEEKSMVLRLTSNMEKAKRNKLWRRRKRRRIAEKQAQQQEQFDIIDHQADEWRAREIANDIAKRKVERMKEITKVKAREERKQLESEMELVLIVEKLKELRSLRTHKMRKQGRFFPDEDDRFLERVRAAAEEEERLAMTAVNVDAAKDAIASAEEVRKVAEEEGEFDGNRDMVMGKKGCGRGGEGGDRDNGPPPNLPAEFYHYYYGSSNDMGTLVQVRRQWDTYLKAGGGSRIPGHWIQPPPPADETWASYLVK